MLSTIDWTVPLMGFYMVILTIPLYLLLCSDTSSSGVNGVISRYFLEKLPKFFSKTLKCCFGEKGFEQLERTYDYVTNQRNPIMQILYTILINAAFGGWMMTGMKKLPTYLVQEHQAYISIVFVLFAQFTYFLACTIGPGTITKENVKCFAHQPFDGLMYLPGSECSSCQIPKVLSTIWLL